MSIPTESYESIHNRFTLSMGWMRDLGIRIDPGRLSNYEKTIRHWKDAYKTASDDEGRKVFPDFVNSMYEITDFIDVHSAFHGESPDRLKSILKKLQKAVNGPIKTVDEKPGSTTARNYLFEAAVAARIHRPSLGSAAILNADSDTGISIGSKRIWVECKRITSPRKIESNIGDASKQLETVLRRKVGSGHRGIVAIDVSKLITPGDQIFVQKNDVALLASLDLMMDQFIKDNSDVWQKVYRRRDKKIIGTIIRFSFMSTSEDRNILVHSSQWGVNPRLEIADSDSSIQRILADTIKKSY